LLPDPKNHKILDTDISKEPLAITIPENDSEWADVVKWVTYAPIQAEEFGITKENINKFLTENTNPAIKRFLGLEDNLGKELGLKNDFAANIIKQLGNYGEIYDRNFPGLGRDRNYLWTDDGLLYSPPFAGTLPDKFTLTNNDNRNLLQEVKGRGKVKLGVTGNSPGFAVQQPTGEWQGFDIELGKAIATAVFGNPSQLEVSVVQNFSQGFDDVANGAIDIFAAGITNNLIRDAGRGVDFSPTYLYTGQDFLVRKDSGITFVSDLNGRTIGITGSTNALQNIQDYLAEFGGNFIPQLFNTNAEMLEAYNQGTIDAISTDQTILAGLIPTLKNPNDHKLLNNTISKEPIALAIDENQSAWGDLVRWVTYSLVQAEELGINSKNIQSLVAINTDGDPKNDSTDEIRTFLGIASNIGQGLGISNDFVVNIIKAVGNYGEIYKRNFNGSILKRDENEIYTNYGLQYSPSFSNSSIAPATVTLQNAIASFAENADTSKGLKVADIAINKDGLGKESLTLKGADVDLFEIRGKELFIKAGAVLNFKTNPQLDITIEVNEPALKDKIKSSASISVTITDTKQPSLTPAIEATLSLTKSEAGKNLLRLNGDISHAKLELALTNKNIGKGNIHEVGMFVVDDTQGRVNGLLPSDSNYLQAALTRSQSIFSIIPDGFVPNPTRNLENFSGRLLSFYLVQNGTTDEVLSNSAASNKVLFGSAANNILQINESDKNQFQLVFEDQMGDSISDLKLNIRLTETTSPLGNRLQGKVERELIDLRDFSGQSVQATFPIVKSEAKYKNTVGFYRVENEEGTVRDTLTGQFLKPGDNGYTQAALRNATINLNKENEGISNIFQGGSIFAPFIIANGTTQQILDNDTKNDVPVYFNYIGAALSTRTYELQALFSDLSCKLREKRYFSAIVNV
jgi:ABC-type amino acid transport substrate-binding protein